MNVVVARLLTPDQFQRVRLGLISEIPQIIVADGLGWLTEAGDPVDEPAFATRLGTNPDFGARLQGVVTSFPVVQGVERRVLDTLSPRRLGSPGVPHDHCRVRGGRPGKL